MVPRAVSRPCKQSSSWPPRLWHHCIGMDRRAIISCAAAGGSSWRAEGLHTRCTARRYLTFELVLTLVLSPEYFATPLSPDFQPMPFAGVHPRTHDSSLSCVPGLSTAISPHGSRRLPSRHSRPGVRGLPFTSRLPRSAIHARPLLVMHGLRGAGSVAIVGLFGAAFVLQLYWSVGIFQKAGRAIRQLVAPKKEQAE